MYGVVTVAAVLCAFPPFVLFLRSAPFLSTVKRMMYGFGDSRDVAVSNPRSPSFECNFAALVVHDYVENWLRSTLLLGTSLHHIASHYITSHYITSHYITSHHITLHYITLYHIISHYIALHYITLYHIT